MSSSISLDVRVEDVMTPNPVTVPLNLPLSSLARLLNEKGITGAPVVNEDGDLVGVVSQTDLVRQRAQEADFDEGPAPRAFHEIPDLKSLGWFEEDMVRERPDEPRVADVYTDSVLTANLDNTVIETIATFVDNAVHRIVVVDGLKPVGILSAMDILRGIHEATRQA